MPLTAPELHHVHTLAITTLPRDAIPAIDAPLYSFATHALRNLDLDPPVLGYSPSTPSHASSSPHLPPASHAASWFPSFAAAVRTSVSVALPSYGTPSIG